MGFGLANGNPGALSFYLCCIHKSITLLQLVEKDVAGSAFPRVKI